MKHIYLNTSNFEHMPFIDECVIFEHVHNYDPISYSKTMQYEWGIIKTPNITFHLLIGTSPQKGCPWCGTEVVFKEMQDFDGDIGKCCMVCHRCGARGPIWSFNRQIINDPKSMDYLRDRVDAQFERRRAWDADLVNPYD